MVVLAVGCVAARSCLMRDPISFMSDNEDNIGSFLIKELGRWMIDRI